MKLENITDLHNRRGNIGHVARRCQRNLYPLLAWPEDKLLLRLSDLPLIQGRRPNLPPTWTRTLEISKGLFQTDDSLRERITPGKAYYRSFADCHGLQQVIELKVETL